jgi:hypothetical protein
VSKKPFDLLKNYLGALSVSTVQPREIPRPAIAISRESGAGALNVATLVAQELNTVCPGEPPCPWVVFTGNLPGKILEDHFVRPRSRPRYRLATLEQGRVFALPISHVSLVVPVLKQVIENQA